MTKPSAKIEWSGTVVQPNALRIRAILAVLAMGLAETAAQAEEPVIIEDDPVQAGKPIVIENDYGGWLHVYSKRVIDLRFGIPASKSRGTCASACTLIYVTPALAFIAMRC